MKFISFLYFLCLGRSKVCGKCSERSPIHMFETKSKLCEMCDAQQEEKILERSHQRYKMNSYCVVCKKKTDSANPKPFRTKNNRLMIKSICKVCGNKKSTFVKEQDAAGLLSSLGIKTPLANIPGFNLLF